MELRVLDVALAGAGAAGYLAVYVLPLHLVPGPRDSPRVLRFRLGATAVSSTLLTFLPPFLALYRLNGQAPSARELAAQLGLIGPLSSALVGLSVTAVLFAGPLAYEAQEAADRARNGLRPWVRMRTTLQVLRDCVVAPVTEELVFRASLPAFLRAACPPLGAAAAAGAALLVFAGAHCHHVFERLRHGGHSLRTALGATAFQALYTGVFGAYGSLLLHSTRSVAAPIAAHVLCNAQGVPPFASMRRHRRAALLMTVTGLGAAAWLGLVARQASVATSHGGV